MQRLREHALTMVSLVFFVLALAQPARSGTWVVLGIVFLVLSLRRLRAS